MVHSHDFYKLYQTTYEKYRDLYGKQVCVFLQKGSFYEIYGQEHPATREQLNTGKQILELMDIVIHVYPEDGPGGTTGYYGGVPIYTLDKWGSKLTKQGWSIAVIDEIKNGADKVSRREVSKVLSAGTHLEAAEFGKLHCVSALWMEGSVTAPPSFGVATADLTTGQVFLYEGRATGKPDLWHTDDLRHFFQVYSPKELLFFYRGPFTPTDEDSLRRTLYIPSAPIHTVSNQPQGNLENPVTRAEYLQQLFQPRSALPLRTWLRCAEDGSSLQERALCSLLRFAEDHAPKLAEQLQAPTVWHPHQNLQVINNALTQLNLISSSPDQQSVADLFITPQTAMGKRSLTATLCSPLADSKEIQRRQETLEWLLTAPKKTQDELYSCLSEIYDLARLHRTLVRGTITAADVLLLYRSYTAAGFLWKALKQSPFSLGEDFGAICRTCLTAFEALFDVQKAKVAEQTPEEMGFLHQSVAPICFETEAKIQGVYQKAEAWLHDLRTLAAIDSKALCYKPTEKNMFSIHATKTALKQVETALKKLSHQEQGTFAKLNLKTLTSSGRVEHPDLTAFQEELDVHKKYLERALKVELPPVCIQYILKTRDLWQPLEEWVTGVDLCLTMAKTSKQQGWVKPIILESTATEASILQIENLRHPLIEAQKRQSKLVTHDVRLGTKEDGSGWLLYGMNASGKSSLMKAIGIAVLLAQVGCYIPATEMTLRPFRKLATRILNQDNLWAGLSSFAVEMSELREILSVADNQTLVLGDELCAGTESISGTAIVAAGIQHLSKAGARFVLATHLHDLMKLPAINTLPSLRVWHLHVEYEPVTDLLIYHRVLRPGSGSSKYGLEVAKALHLPRDMIDAAFELRRQLLGEAAVESAEVSQYNSSLLRRQCSACKVQIAEHLEVHHLKHQADANNNRNNDGTALNDIRNLAVLCTSCHDKEHAEQLLVGPVEDTSEGPRRQVLDLSQFAYRPPEGTLKKGHASPFSAEQLETIKTYRRQYTALSPKLLAFQIQSEAGIDISEAYLKTLLKKGFI